MISPCHERTKHKCWSVLTVSSTCLQGWKLKASFFSRIWNHEDSGITVQIKGWSIIAFLWTSLVGTTYKSQSKTWNLMSLHITADLSNCFIGLLPLCIAFSSRNVVSWEKLLKKLFCDFWSFVLKCGFSEVLNFWFFQNLKHNLIVSTIFFKTPILGESIEVSPKMFLDGSTTNSNTDLLVWEDAFLYLGF